MGPKPFIARYLDPTEALGEALFGLIMVLTFTVGAGVIVGESRDATTELLWAILGCNLAWGIIDGAMYVMSCMLERSRKARLMHGLRAATNDEQALAHVARALDDRLEPLTSSDERERLYRAVLVRLKDVEPERVRPQKEDFLGALTCAVLVFVSAAPAVVPFLLFRDRLVALRVSNLLLIATLFFVGHRWARSAHANPWLVGSLLVLLGVTLVAVAIPLGG